MISGIKSEDDCPIYNANPDNLEKVLDNILQNPSQLIKRGEDSRKYALELSFTKKYC